eukprot:scaffold197120_cov20-Tisochrysis_lutea.AAC.3
MGCFVRLTHWPLGRSCHSCYGVGLSQSVHGLCLKQRLLHKTAVQQQVVQAGRADAGGALLGCLPGCCCWGHAAGYCPLHPLHMRLCGGGAWRWGMGRMAAPGSQSSCSETRARGAQTPHLEGHRPLRG